MIPDDYTGAESIAVGRCSSLVLPARQLDPAFCAATAPAAALQPRNQLRRSCAMLDRGDQVLGMKLQLLQPDLFQLLI